MRNEGGCRRRGEVYDDPFPSRTESCHQATSCLVLHFLGGPKAINRPRWLLWEADVERRRQREAGGGGEVKLSPSGSLAAAAAAAFRSAQAAWQFPRIVNVPLCASSAAFTFRVPTWSIPFNPERVSGSLPPNPINSHMRRWLGERERGERSG